MNELKEVQERLASMDPNNRDHLAEIQRLKTREMELSSQLQLEEEQAVRIQAQEEKLTGLAQYIADLGLLDHIKGALEEDLSFDELGELRKQTNQLVHDIVKEHLQSELAELNAVIVEKDEKIRMLNKQTLEDRQSLDKLNDDVRLLCERNSELSSELAAITEKCNRQALEIGRLDEEKASLEIQLATAREEVLSLQEKAQRSVITTSAPSQSVQDRLAAMKSIGKKSTNDVIDAFAERMKNKGVPDAQLPKVELPAIAIEPTESPFRPIELGNGEVLHQDSDNANSISQPVEQFQTPYYTGSNTGLPMGGDTAVQESNGATVEERIARLEERVSQLEVICAE